MAYKYIMTDGTKSINPMTDERPGVWSNVPSDVTKAARGAKLVPSVFAGISARTQAMADMPFAIYSVKGDKELDNSDNYKNVVGFLPYPSRTFALTEGSLVTAGRSYWFRGNGTRTGQTKELRYWIPSSVQLDTENAKKNIIKFQRTGVSNMYTADEVLYTWLIDPDVELGPPLIWPLESAMIAAQANGSINAWVSDYMSRGAIKAMLLMVDGMPPAGEVERMETWFNRFMSGARGLAWKVFNSAGVKPTIVGDGLEALGDLSINAELRYEIHTALGTRHLLEDENYATAQSRERQFYTMTIVPDARTIQYSWNEQILHNAGYHLEFEPQRLEAFQEDEGEQATAFLTLFEGFSKVMTVETAFQLASEKLDYIFTDAQTKLIKKSIAEKNKPVEVIAPKEDKPDTVPPEIVKALVELDKWEKKVNAAGKMVTWHAVDLLPETVKAIKDGMTFDEARESVKRNGLLKSAFGKTLPPPPDTDAIKALADSINRLAEPQHTKDNMNIIIDTQGNHIKTAQDGNAQILEAIKALVLQNSVKADIVIPAPIVTVNMPEQPAPIVNVSAPVTVSPSTPAVNNITVKPADVILPAAPTEATITTDRNGKKTLKVK